MPVPMPLGHWVCNSANSSIKKRRSRFDSVWVNDYVVIPTPLVNQFSVRLLGRLLGFGKRHSAHEWVKLGSSVIVLPSRHPIVQAKILTTLDALSNRRVIFGLSAGGIESEYHALGVPFAHRGTLADEMIQVIQELWASDNPSFQGKHYGFSDIKFGPKPVQQPGIPMWIGGGTDGGLRSAARYGDAWHPIISAVDAIKPGMKTFAETWRQAGRRGEPQVNVLFGCRIFQTPLASHQEIGKGSAEQVLQNLIAVRDLAIS